MSGVSRDEMRPAGYSALLERFGNWGAPNWHQSIVASGTVRRTESAGMTVLDVYPATYWPGDSSVDHLEFALKYDGTNLALLASLLPAISREEITRYVRSRPTGKYARRIWFFYEMLTGEQLDVGHSIGSGFVDLVDPEEQYTSSIAVPVRRQKVRDNLLGDVRFCPTIRRTPRLEAMRAKDLTLRAAQLAASYPPDLLRRALGYLYTKETKSSFEIERIRPNASRIERFVTLLQTASTEDFCVKPQLIDLQNQIVEPRFKEADYRTNQNYVGESLGFGRERVHYICPRPEQVPDLMAGLIEAHRRMESGKLHPVLEAAAIAYGFVFVHPFEDGNGRIHRLLIHNILSRRGFTPAGVVVPVSAAMLRQPADYDASLEAFSRPIVDLADYSLDDQGRMTVQNDLGPLYRYPDMTAQAEALFSFVEQSIETDMVEELDFLASYDRTKPAMQEIVDMPDRELNLFLRLCIQNNGVLSSAKRSAHFSYLTDDEVRRLEEAVAEGFRRPPRGAS